MMSRLPDQLDRHDPQRDDQGSISMALLIVMVMSFLAASLFPYVMTHLRSTRTDAQQVGALSAAQAGLEAGLAQLRAAQTTAGLGIVAQLPCSSSSGLLTAGASQSYTVAISYFSTNPSGQSASWLSANALSCSSGSGPASTPSYALLVSVGSDAQNSTGTQSLTATYTFNRVYDNSVGAPLLTTSATTGGTLCVDAGTTVTTGATPTLQPCASVGSQSFVYGANLSLRLASSVSSAHPLGICLQVGDLWQAALHHYVGEPVVLADCTNPSSVSQEFSYSSDNTFHSSSDGVTNDQFCIQTTNGNSVGAALVLGCPTPTVSFAPGAGAGVGAAGTQRNQLVVAGQYARCLNVPNPAQGSSYLTMAYLTVAPCDQAPAATAANQQWSTPAISTNSSSVTATITTTLAATSYCLTSNGYGQYPTLSGCQAGAATQQWSISATSANPAGDYRLTNAGNCLTATNPSTDADPDTGYSKAVMTTCVNTGSSAAALQQWNVPATLNRVSAVTMN